MLNSVDRSLLRSIPRAAALFALAVSAGQSLAQPASPGPSTAGQASEQTTQRKEEGKPGWNATLDFNLNHAFRADLSDGPGKVSVTRGGAELGVTGPLFERTLLITKLGTEISGYDFKDATAFAPTTGEPWDTIYDYSLSAGVTHIYDEKWSSIAIFRVRSTGESGADFGDTLTYGGFVGGTYAVNERLRLGLSVGVSTQIEDNLQVLPLPSVYWKIADEWTLDVGSLRGVSLAYQPSEQWKFWGFFDYSARSFRLDENNGAAPGGVGRDKSFNAAINATWSPTKQISLTASAGYIFGQELVLDNAAGDRIRKDDVDATPFLGISADFRF
ncbi:MAG: DUF6268 family outer membrane beta-barrel protein [Planctomycetota bacterium]|nr:DUF6268 family outer membrane beta-barrel protein [Planctomycetota bacterium]